MDIFQLSAKIIHTIYLPSCEFPEWVLEPQEWANHRFSETKVYYMKTDSLEDVKQMATQREPCNICMKRLYSESRLEQEFGWTHGAYERSTPDKLMPNIAIYCYATVKRPNRTLNIHVINLVGYAFDTQDQPDYKYFQIRPKIDLIQKYSEMWLKALKAAKDLREENKINKIRIFNVGGGAFAGPYSMNFIDTVFEPAFLSLIQEFTKLDIQVIGYNAITKRFDDVFIPNLFDAPDEDVDNTLYVNAWDPWSLIGNGNERDRSLDGYMGRCSNMAVLGWTRTNPSMIFVPV